MAFVFTAAWLLGDVTLTADPMVFSHSFWMRRFFRLSKSLPGVSSRRCFKWPAGLLCSGGEGVESAL